MAVNNTLDKTATETIELLEARLRRIEYAISGRQVEYPVPSNQQASAASRLTDLEHSLHQLASKSRVIQDLLRLREDGTSLYDCKLILVDARHPDLFQSVATDDLPTTLDTSSILSIIFASATSYPLTASRLTSIRDVPVPPAELSTQLIELQPRIAKVEAIQAAQNSDIATLRQRTAAAIQRWYAMDILQAGDSWAGLEERVEQVEQKARRAALAKRMDHDMV
ncbi:hypothetical protein B7494_g7129 [Chlorociboria aeruginascens]|nr:hypothetical protein B7494_g7129 [Chlorociboria aeruginascens]